MKPEQFQEIIKKGAEAMLAQQEIPNEDGYQAVREAHRHLYMLAQGLKGKETVNATLRWLVVGVAETKMWIDCQPDQTRWPDGFNSHGDFIWEAIILAGWANDQKARNIKSLLNKLANLALFASENGVIIDDALNNDYSKLRTGLPAIGRVIDVDTENTEQVAEAVEALREILDDVRKLSPQDFKGKYTVPRHDKAGWGTIQDLTLVARLNSEDDVKRVLRVLGGILEWGLDVKVERSEGGIFVRIEGALDAVWSEAIKEAVG